MPEDNHCGGLLGHFPNGNRSANNTMTELLENVAGDLVLRIRGTNRDGQYLRLRSRKCTIGSGKNCTLRLGSKNIAPLHCLILRGQGSTIVRCWASDTRLNGQAFSDAQLTPGDRLGIGPLEFEVVALNERGESVEKIESVEKRLPSDISASSIPSQGGLREVEREDEKRELNDLMDSLRTEKAALDLRVFQINQDVAALEKEKNAWNWIKRNWIPGEVLSRRNPNGFTPIGRQSNGSSRSKRGNWTIAKLRSTLRRRIWRTP